MSSMTELAGAVTGKALLYLRETDETIERYPVSIVDFVIEYAIKQCHIPNHYSESDTARLLSNYVSTLAMMCNNVYSKIGAEGETAHSEGNTSRTYDAAWISPALISALPNFVNTPSTIGV